MTGIARSAGLTLLLAATAASAAPGQPAPLQPAGKWTVRDVDDRCTLERDYGSPDRPTIVSFTPGTLGTAAGIRVFAPHGVEGRVVRRDDGSVAVQARTVPVTVRSYGPVAGAMRLTGVLVRDLSVYDLVLSPVMTIDRGRAGPPIAIAPGGSPEAVQALDRCEAALLRRQGIDPAATPPLSRPPEPVDGSAARWFRPTDYPRSATGTMPFGHVVARAIVGVDGTVANCTIAEGSGSHDLDAKTCDILRTRGRYVPALDDAGRPVAAPVVVPVNWEPPRR